MAIIPLKDEITVHRQGETGDWGEPIGASESFTLKCRIDEGSRLARTAFAGLESGGSVIRGEEVIEVTSILLNRHADIRYSDTLTYTDLGGTTHTVRPIKISAIKGINSKPILTEVIV